VAARQPPVSSRPVLARPLRALLLAAVALLALSGCGSGGSDAPAGPATVTLDFAPNAVHAGIYSTLVRNYDEGEGVQLTVRAPSSSTDSVKLLLSGRTDFAILDIHDLALARAKGRDVVGVMALVERPLAAVIAQPGTASPRALEGERVGVTGLPSDDAVLASVVAGAGGDPKKVKKVTIGFNAVQSLLTRRVRAATAFWNAEGVALREKRPGMRQFRVDDFGAPSYPELVLCATRQTIDERPNLVRGVVRSLVRGYGVTIHDPESSASDLVDSVKGLERDLVMKELDALTTAFVGAARSFGELDPASLGKWAQWEKRFGVVERPPDVGRAFDGSFVRG
jgi:putative hydroxymethylpyrimidine transport system substrate-binding protein